MTRPENNTRGRCRLLDPVWTSLATIALLVALVSIRIALPVYQRMSAVRDIQRLGGEITGREPLGPAWLRRFASDEGMAQFDKPTHIVFNGSRGNESPLGVISKFPDLQSLSLSSMEINETDLKQLKSFTKLRYLLLSFTTVGDAGLSQLPTLQRLEWLDLSNTRITDAGLHHIARFRKLNNLTLDGNRITDHGLEALSTMQNLDRLSILNCDAITINGVDRLERALPKLRVSHSVWGEPTWEGDLEELNDPAQILPHILRRR